MKPYLILLPLIFTTNIASSATYTIEYGIGGLSLTGGGRTFLTAPSISDIPLTIDDDSIVTVAQAQQYTFTNTNDFGSQNENATNNNRALRINTTSTPSSVSLNLRLAPGSVTIFQSSEITADLDFGGDRKQVSMLTLAASGSGTHTGFIGARFAMTEVLDDPIAVINNFPIEVFSNSDLIFDGSNSSDIDATGSIVGWEWDLNYDGAVFDNDLSGEQATLNQALLNNHYEGSNNYTVALRVTDNSGAQHITTSSFEYSTVPEPSSSLMLLASSTFFLLRRKRK
jgi:hypothetical protein